MAKFHLDHAVCDVEVALIMRHRYNGLPSGGQGGQELFIKILAKFRVLIGRPFIENIDRTVLEQRHDQCQALPLSGRQLQIGKMIPRQGGFLLELELGEEVLDGLLRDIEQAIEFSKQMEVSKDRGKARLIGC